jgi:citronellol/citronellal dehydrogenase
MPYDSVFRPGLFAGQTAIITGGGTGIGRCAAHELTALGASVALVGRRPEPLEATRREIEEDGGRATAHPCDVRDEDAVRGVIEAVLEQHGRIDGLVNNAGGQYMAPLRDMKTKGWEAVIRSNLTGGAIVNMAADVENGWPNVAHSGAARAGMINFTESAAAEWAHSGVRVNAVAPGAIKTSGEFTYSEEEKKPFKNYVRRIPLQRRGTEAEASAVIVFLLSPGASYITGSTIRIDGGTPNARQIERLMEHSRSKVYNGLHRSPGYSAQD